MRKILLAAVLAAILVVSVSAENVVIDSKGAMGLQFGIGGYGDFGFGGVPVRLDSGTYAGIGGKYLLADKIGIGCGLLLGGDAVDADNSDFWFGIRPELSYTLAKKGAVALYTGGYLGLGIEKAETAGTTTTTTVFEFGGRIGTEWAFASQVSIAAEYDLGAAFYDGHTTWGAMGSRFYLTFYI